MKKKLFRQKIAGVKRLNGRFLSNKWHLYSIPGISTLPRSETMHVCEGHDLILPWNDTCGRIWCYHDYQLSLELTKDGEVVARLAKSRNEDWTFTSVVPDFLGRLSFLDGGFSSLKLSPVRADDSGSYTLTGTTRTGNRILHLGNRNSSVRLDVIVFARSNGMYCEKDGGTISFGNYRTISKFLSPDALLIHGSIKLRFSLSLVL